MFSYYVVILNTDIPSRGSKEERIGIRLLACPYIYSKYIYIMSPIYRTRSV